MKKNKKILKIYILSFLILIIACDKKEKFINDPKDISIATDLTTNFYNDLDNFDTLKISKYLSKEIDNEKFNNGIVDLIKKGGQRLKVDVNRVETNTEIFNRNKNSTYNIEVISKYEKLTAIEILSFIQSENSQFELVGFSSDLKQNN